jgi:exoribonuclease-2
LATKGGASLHRIVRSPERWLRIGRRFDAIATGASPEGVWVRVFSPPAEGKLVTRKADLRVGDKVHVKLVATNVERGFIDFVPAD